MAAKATITRRAAIVGAAAASVSVISPALGSVYRSGAQSADDQLIELVDHFKQDAMAIDPSITGLWLGHDATIPGRRSAVVSLYLEREHAPFVRKGKPKPDPLVVAIAAYRAAMDEYNSTPHPTNELADAHAAVSYEPPLAVLQNWKSPAASYAGAIEALKLAVEEVATFGGGGAGAPMIAAALAYLER